MYYPHELPDNIKKEFEDLVKNEEAIKRFLVLIDRDIEENYGAIKPLISELLDEISELIQGVELDDLDEPLDDDDE